MPIKGGRSNFSENIQSAKEVIRSIINLLEPEFEKLGYSNTMTRSQKAQLSQEVDDKINNLDDLMAPVRRNGVKPDDEYNSMFARAGELIQRLETYSETGGRRRRKTRRAKTVRRK
jgi:hypothetical protein